MPFKISGMKPGRFRAEVEKRITALKIRYDPSAVHTWLNTQDAFGR